MQLGEDLFGTVGFGTSINAEGTLLPWYETCPSSDPETVWTEIEPFEYDIVRCEDAS